MSFKATWFRDKLNKKAKRGFRGYPVATITYYGPDDRQASKVSVGIVLDEGGDVAFLERWLNERQDIRKDPEVNEQIVRFLSKHGAKSVVMPDRILGCPHEEGKDYPEGEKCPKCSYWAIRFLMKIMDGSSVEDAIRRLKAYPEILYAEPNYARDLKDK